MCPGVAPISKQRNTSLSHSTVSKFSLAVHAILPSICHLRKKSMWHMLCVKLCISYMMDLMEIFHKSNICSKSFTGFIKFYNMEHKACVISTSQKKLEETWFSFSLIFSLSIHHIKTVHFWVCMEMSPISNFHQKSLVEPFTHTRNIFYVEQWKALICFQS